MVLGLPVVGMGAKVGIQDSQGSDVVAVVIGIPLNDERMSVKFLDCSNVPKVLDRNSVMKPLLDCGRFVVEEAVSEDLVEMSHLSLDSDTINSRYSWVRLAEE